MLVNMYFAGMKRDVLPLTEEALKNWKIDAISGMGQTVHKVNPHIG